MPAGRGVDEDQSSKDQVVFYLPVLYHLRLSLRHLPLYGVLAEYQKIYTDSGSRQGIK